MDQMKTGITIKGRETFALTYFKILKEGIFTILIGKIYHLIDIFGRPLSLTLAIKG